MNVIEQMASEFRQKNSFLSIPDNSRYCTKSDVAYLCANLVVKMYCTVLFKERLFPC